MQAVFRFNTALYENNIVLIYKSADTDLLGTADRVSGARELHGEPVRLADKGALQCAQNFTTPS